MIQLDQGTLTPAVKALFDISDPTGLRLADMVELQQGKSGLSRSGSEVGLPDRESLSIDCLEQG